MDYTLSVSVGSRQEKEIYRLKNVQISALFSELGEEEKQVETVGGEFHIGCDHFELHEAGN